MDRENANHYNDNTLIIKASSYWIYLYPEKMIQLRRVISVKWLNLLNNNQQLSWTRQKIKKKISSFGNGLGKDDFLQDLNFPFLETTPTRTGSIHPAAAEMKKDSPK